MPRLVPAPLLEKANSRLVAAEVTGNEFVGPPLGAVLFVAAADSAWFAIFVLYVDDVLALPATAYGALLATGAVGGLAGAAVADRLVAGRRHRQVLTWVIGTSRTLVYGGAAVGAVLGGLLAGGYGLRAPFILSGAVAVAATAAWVFTAGDDGHFGRGDATG